ncbi:universal stress protein [Dactylosporangium sp. NPDC048998]|uniref:universal stress protein n=1 Tax=Dactylosporangium sp. NPDC048998 TaxID=3363976 RepID=UPI0037132863
MNAPSPAFSMSPSMAPSTAVVVGVDGSRDGVRAVQWAAADAARRHLPLHLLHACGAPGRAGPGPGPGSLAAGGPPPEGSPAHLLAEAVVQARDIGLELRITTESVARRPGAALVAASRRAAEVVVGGRGTGGFAELLTGSTAAQLVTHAACPAVVVRPREGDGPNAGRVVVGVDGSGHARDAVRFAFEQAAFRRAGLTALHAYQVPAAITADRYELEGMRDAERRVLSESIAGCRETYPEVDVRTDIAAGRAAGVLVRASAGAQLLVVGARGRGGFAGLRLGSVGRAAIHHAPCPVAVVRPRPGGSHA